MTTKPTHFEMPRLIPRPGEALLFIDLGVLEHHSITEALNKCQELGFTPELRYCQNQNGTFWFALLKHEQFSRENFEESERLSEDWERLAIAFQPDDMAVRCPRGLYRQTKETVAA